MLHENLEAITGFNPAFLETMLQIVSFEAPYLIQVVKLIWGKILFKGTKYFSKSIKKFKVRGADTGFYSVLLETMDQGVSFFEASYTIQMAKPNGQSLTVDHLYLSSTLLYS